MTDPQYAQSRAILDHIGGWPALSTMLAASNVTIGPVDDRPTLTFQFRGHRTYNVARVTLDADDTYRLTLTRAPAFGAARTPDRVVDGIHAETLTHAFETATGLYLRITPS